MPKKTSIFLIILLCILITIAGGAASYLYLANTHKEETQSLEDQVENLENNIKNLRQEKNTKSTIKQTITQTNNPTTKTAIVTQLNLSFDYPASWGDVSIKQTDIENTKTGSTNNISFSSEPKYISMGFASSDFETILGRGGAFYEGAAKFFPTKLTDCKTYNNFDSDSKKCTEVTKNNKIVGIISQNNNPEGSMFGINWTQVFYLTSNPQFPVIALLESEVNPESSVPISTYENLLKSFKPIN